MTRIQLCIATRGPKRHGKVGTRNEETRLRSSEMFIAY